MSAKPGNLVWILVSSGLLGLCLSAPCMVVELFWTIATAGEYRSHSWPLVMVIGVFSGLAYHAYVWFNSQNDS